MSPTRIDPEMTTGLVKTDEKAPVDGTTAGEAGDVVALNSGLKVDYNHLPVGTAENNLIQLGSGGKVATDRLDVGTGANQLGQLTGSGILPVLDGSQLENVVTGTIASGQVVKIAYTQKTDSIEDSITEGDAHTIQDTEISGMAVSITPAASGNKVRIDVSWCGEPESVHFKTSHIFYLKRTIDSADVDLVNNQSTPGSNRLLGIMPASGDLTYPGKVMQTCHFSYWDAPSTDEATTYQLM